ncbi:carbohydrate kinase family protein [Streptomyces sp. H27-D2]|uniref:carbohydrate kinase family protein n=1 Tax=Streptomyces sp. H27-D2 TaxID=3046304 RepID=UPI002DBD26BF|nr:carbohydrate kinase family protein [Streptomyces sp. H27-D2]MEC4017379.1 carbohydrate kinase family protein [Streptomyces sp. H27-D2]
MRLELRTRLPNRRFTQLSRTHFAYAPVDFVVSGTSVNMARHARSHFARVNVLAKVGDDALTSVVEEELRALGVHARLHVAKGMPNGFVVMVWDTPRVPRPRRAPDGVRLLIASDPSPGCSLGVADVRASYDLLRDADVVLCDGYSLLSPTSRAAVGEALSLARAAGVRTAFDLVPHDIDRRLPFSDVLPAIAAADLVIVEAATLARLFGLPPDTGVGEDLLVALDRKAPGRPLWLLRHGAGGMQNVLAYRRDGLRHAYTTGYVDAADKVGEGDRVATAELYWWLSNGAGGLSGL